MIDSPKPTTKRWEKLWGAYIDALMKLDIAKDDPDRRVAAGARRSVKAAKRAMRQFDLDLMAMIIKKP